MHTVQTELKWNIFLGSEVRLSSLFISTFRVALGTYDA